MDFQNTKGGLYAIVPGTGTSVNDDKWKKPQALRPNAAHRVRHFPGLKTFPYAEGVLVQVCETCNWYTGSKEALISAGVAKAEWFQRCKQFSKYGTGMRTNWNFRFWAEQMGMGSKAVIPL